MLRAVFFQPQSPLTPAALWSSWNIDAWILLPLALAIYIYVRGLLLLWKRAGRGYGITRRNGLCFAGAALVILIALISPLDALSADLFTAHMVQHLLLIMVAAPLLVGSKFQLALVWALPRSWSKPLGHGWASVPAWTRLWKGFGSPLFAWLSFGLALWLWHAAAFFEAALRNETIHTLEHFCFLFTSILFWRVLLKINGPAHIHYGKAIPYLFSTVLHSGFLGALMTFATQPWYPSYTAQLSAPWGMTPLVDQQIAGLIMWIPGGFVFTFLTIFYFAAWFRSLDQRESLADSQPSLYRHPEIK